MLKLEQHTYLPADIEAATGGYCSRKVQQVWHARGVWYTPTKVPEAGKPRPYCLIHVYEAAILSTGLRHGLSLGQCRQAIKNRAEARRAELDHDASGSTAYFEGEAAEAIYFLPEFHSVDPEHPYHWVIYFSDGLARPPAPPPVNSCGVVGPNDRRTLSEITRKAPYAVLLNITAILHRVNTILTERIGSAEDADRED